MKITKRTIIQKVDGKTICHQKPFKHSGSSMKFMARHGIKPMTMIANGFKIPKGFQLKLEKDKIKNKISGLSANQRRLVMEA